MRNRLRLAALGATVVAGLISTGGTALAATNHQWSPQAQGCCWDHRNHDRNWDGRDRHEWRGRDWDHSGSGWNWEQQCDWAWRNDRDWWRSHCS